MASDALVWVLCDDRAGNVGQALGVAEALNLPFKRVDISYTMLARLPNFMIGASLLGLDSETKKVITGPWPDLVIGAGRRTAPVARYIKRQSAGKTKIVQLMHPGKSGAGEFDLICVPSHDDHELQLNEMEMVGAPHRVTDEKLEQAKVHWQDRFANLPNPRIGLIVGGATKNREFSIEMASSLAQTINDLALKNNASVLVTTSRRTGDAASALMAGLTVPSYTFKWGDEGENPYFGFLSSADHLIVTGDSVSMCSECCATGKPVYIYAPEGMISEKHQRMVASLCEKGFAQKFEGKLNGQGGKKLNAALDITRAIKEKLL